MAELLGYIDFVGHDGPAFLIPVFRAYPGANTLEVQIINELDQVAGFEAIEPHGQIFIGADRFLAVDDGAPAVWAFRDAEGVIHVDSADQLAAPADDCLRDGQLLDEHPIFAAELVQFCHLELGHPNVLKRAYAVLASESENAADVWRDTSILAPAIRRDLRRLRARTGEPLAEDDMIVLARAGVIEVYTERPWPDSTPMRETMAIGDVFGLRDMIISPLVPAGRRHDAEKGDLLFIGSGGIARSIMREPRFQATPMRWTNKSRSAGAMALGFVENWNGGITPERPLYIGLSQSDPDQVELAVGLAKTGPEGAVQHLINIRPVGYGVTPQNKIAIDGLLDRAQTFDVVWIIPNHRHRNLRGQANNLASSSFVARIVRALVLSLLSRHGSLPELRWANGGRRGSPALALAGTVRMIKGEALTDLLRRLIHAMLCDEAAVHTAAAITALLPYPVDERDGPISVDLGPREYSVHLLTRLNPGRSREAVGWAVGVDRSGEDQAAYRLFCQSLLAAYDWEFRDDDREGFLILHRGDALRVLTINDGRWLRDVVRRDAEQSHPCVLLTNQQLDPDLRRLADEGGWLLLHHAEIAAWMAADFGARPFEPW